MTNTQLKVHFYQVKKEAIVSTAVPKVSFWDQKLDSYYQGLQQLIEETITKHPKWIQP